MERAVVILVRTHAMMDQMRVGVVDMVSIKR